MMRMVATGCLAAIVIAAGAGAVSAENNAATGLSTRLNASASANDAQQVSALDEEARQPGGDARVQQRLASQFGVQKTTIDQLRSKDLGYGEIQHVLHLSAQLPGGASSDNVNRVVALHDQKVSWPQIAQQLNVQSMTDTGAAGSVPSNDVSRSTDTKSGVGGTTTGTSAGM